jgi:hypothetical protein
LPDDSDFLGVLDFSSSWGRFNKSASVVIYRQTRIG